MKLQLLVLLLLVFATGCTDYGKKKMFKEVELYYTKGVTEAEANALGEYLLRSGFDNGERKTVQISKPGKTYEFRMVVKKGIEDQQEYNTLFRQFAAAISKDVFNGADVEMHACDEQLKTLKVFVMSEDGGVN